jgi:peptide-methionine (S)-S-oxide reductase
MALPETKGHQMKSITLLGIFLSAMIMSPAASEEKLEIATFAGGCFWCVESDFEHVSGVVSAVSGYTGGMLAKPTYRDHGQHIEAVQIKFDPTIISYKQMLDIFWRSIDPTDAGGQFCDRGNTYTTAVFANSAEQLEIAKASKEELEKSARLGAPIVTPIRKAAHWTDAEDYHQDYYKTNPVRYKFYRFNCGRDSRIEELWEDEAHAGINKGK